jgi:hypothetical protein
MLDVLSNKKLRKASSDLLIGQIAGKKFQE